MKSFRKYSALLLLALFVFPYVEKGIHDFEHADDFHCTSSSKHFHITEHSCSICDFITPVSTEPSAPHFDLTPIVSHEIIISYTQSGFISAPDYFFSLRAPPALI